MSVAAIIGLVLAGVSTLSSILTPIILARRARAGGAAPDVPAGTPMPGPITIPPAVAFPPVAPTIPAGPGSHPVLDALAHAILSHQTADLLTQAMGGLAKGGTQGGTSGQVGSELLALAQQVLPLLPQILQMFAPQATAVAK